MFEGRDGRLGRNDRRDCCVRGGGSSGQTLEPTVRDTRATRTLFDGSRAPAGRHTAWAYCHVPNGSKLDMLSRLENQVERFAPGFRERILARRIFAPSDLECRDANLVGGDVQGGAFEVRQFLFRPSWRGYSTSDKNIYICSASTPPGVGVHGMCGFHAARLAVSRLGLSQAGVGPGNRKITFKHQSLSAGQQGSTAFRVPQTASRLRS